MPLKKAEPALGGNSAGSFRPGLVGDGEGTPTGPSCSGPRGARFSIDLLVAAAGDVELATAGLAGQRNPQLRVLLRLALEEFVAGVGPQQDGAAAVVEDQ